MKTIDQTALKKALISASNNLHNNSSRINALNIFPVPDGDTGSNMSSTFKNAVQNLNSKKYENIEEMLKQFSKDMLLGARGNSGVILSQIFKGFYEGWKKCEVISNQNLVIGFQKAYEYAYSSVLKPIEGTILTVIRETFENLKKLDLSKLSILETFAKIKNFARTSCDNTPNLLAVLKEANVVDSGGEGLFIILDGIYQSLNGKDVIISDQIEQQEKFISETEIYDGEFGYCTEVIIELKKPEKFDKKALSLKIEKLGNSLVIVNDNEILKIHIHVLKPGLILNELQKYGEFIKIKSENMTLQANETKQKIENSKIKNTGSKIKKKSAIISCNSGSGIITLMKEYECDFLIEGGQSNNPSIQDFIEAINEVNSDNIFILPNNKNTILAAQQASKMIKNKNIFVIPTKTQVEGITALINFSSELNPEDNLEEIKSSLKNLVIGEVTQAIKDTKIENVSIKNGDYLQIKNNKIIGSHKDLIKSTQNLIKKMMKDKSDPEIIVIYYGADSSLMEAEKLQKFIEENYDVEVEINNGDQPIYNFLISIE
ncbi:MAG: DAK2 domain-containing protein [Metamycoplasmataceae bacterium]